MTNFEQAMARLFPFEGGYVDDPEDPGGETKYGICKRDHPDVNIKDLTVEEAQGIYFEKFWMPIHGNDIPFQIADQLMDFAVNAGINTSIREAQNAIGVADDGHWGPVTQEAMGKVSQGLFTARFAANKIRHYTSLPAAKWAKFS